MAQVFDHFYAEYDSWYETPVGDFVDWVETQAAFGLLGPSTGMHVLDVGCGTGNFSFKLAQMGCRVTGIDVSEKMLEQAREKLAQRPQLPIAFEGMDACRMSFADSSFDAVLSMAAFEFIDHAEAAYREMYRVVRPGGAVVVGTIQKGGAWHAHYTGAAFGDSAYARASFRDLDGLRALDPDHFARAVQCLYTPPGLDDEAYNLKNEVLYEARGGVGGFVCLKFVKPL